MRLAHVMADTLVAARPQDKGLQSATRPSVFAGDHGATLATTPRQERRRLSIRPSRCPSTGPHVGFPFRGWLDHQPDEEPAMNSPERQDAMSARDRGRSGVLQVAIARTTVGPWFRAATGIITVSSGTPGCSGSLLPDRGRARSVAWFRR
jgi:hypothetical protein